MQMTTISRTRKLVGTAMLAAVSVVLMFLAFPVPLMPSFIKLDLAELPALIGAYAYGPLAGVAVCLVKNLISLMKSSSGGVGTLCNFLLGVCFVVPAGLIYKYHRDRKSAFLGALAGAVIMAVVSVFVNYWVIYPIYTAFMPMEAIIGMYQAINPKVENLWQALLIFNMPFTFIKGMISVAIAFVIYKPLSPFLKGTGTAKSGRADG